MQKVRFESLDVTGLSVRTNNQAEMNPDTAKIGGLWASFNKDMAPTLSEQSSVFGVYTNYESDDSGDYDVIACTDVSNSDQWETHKIKAGDYLVFKGSGEMPNAVFELWGQIWAYFHEENCPHTRAYTTDFELYKSGDEIEIYIAV